MNLDIRRSLIGLIAIVVMGTVNAASVRGGDGEEERFSDVKEKLEEAIEQRNFHDAKEHLAALFPIMKEDIKESKKTLHSMQKEGIDAAEFEASLERKNELFDSMKALVDISSAALRVKADDVLAMVKEYNDLVQS